MALLYDAKTAEVPNLFYVPEFARATARRERRSPLARRRDTPRQMIDPITVV